MNQEIYKVKIELISQIFTNYRFNLSNNEIEAFCPNCNHHKRKLIINIEKNVFHCWVCNFSGHISKLIKIYGNEIIWRNWQRAINQLDFGYDLHNYLSKSDITISKTNQQKYISLPVEAIKLRDATQSALAKNFLSFLLKRGLSYQIIRTYNFYYAEEGKYKDRVIIPSYDKDGKLNFFVARSIYNSPNITKYIYPKTTKEDIIFNELMITWDRPIILVEGPFDAIAINYNAIPLLGLSLNEKSALFKKILNVKPEVILMLDNDEAGREGTIKIGKLLTDWGINTSISDYRAKDPGELSRKDILQAIRNRKKLMQSDIMRRILE